MFNLLISANPDAWKQGVYELDRSRVFEYTDAPNLSKAFSDFGICTIPSAEELNRPLIQDMWTELAAAEQKRIRYFRPKRVGDVIFNFWD